MSDIVERLRDLAAIDNCQASREAAAEIERLRAALEAWDDAVLINIVMEGPRFAGTRWKQAEVAWEKTRAALAQPAQKEE